jgi:AcrR family transcriptional regulator
MATRRDVQRNRARILAAASRVFRELGVNAPLEVVVEAAGVGRATVYRHFPDRRALLSAVLEERVGAVEQFAAEHVGDDLLERLVVEICWYMADMRGLVAAMGGSDVDADTVNDVTTRTFRLLNQALSSAIEAGAVRADTSLNDVLLITAMLDAVATTDPLGTDERQVSRALEICFDGVRSASASTRSLPLPLLR